MRWPLPYFGYLIFALYMRWFLTPLSAMTWANLNHTLCSVDNDPWKAYFGMGKHYFFWADFYLALVSIVSQYFIGIFGILLCTSFTAYPVNIKNRQILVGVLLVAGMLVFAYYAIFQLVTESDYNSLKYAPGSHE